MLYLFFDLPVLFGGALLTFGFLLFLLCSLILCLFCIFLFLFQFFLLCLLFGKMLLFLYLLPLCVCLEEPSGKRSSGRA